MRKTILGSVMLLLTIVLLSRLGAAERSARVELKRDDSAGRLQVLIGGKEALVYCYGAELDLPYYYPVRSPDGKSITVQRPQDHLHHCSFWFADNVSLAGRRAVNFYGAIYSREDKSDPNSPFRDHIRHVEFLPDIVRNAQPVIRAKLLWEMDRKIPVLDEFREMRVVALGKGEYFLDMKFIVTAAYGDVTFCSKLNLYAWPYVRVNRQFSVEEGGRITNSEGGVNQKQTNGKVAQWVDYSNTVDGETAGLAIFSHTENEHPHGWLTRDYGCFGPRRADARSGKQFTLKKGESLAQRVGVLVHRGDVKAGRVGQRYKQYVNGEL